VKHADTWAALTAGAIGGAIVGLADGLIATLTGVSAARAWWVILASIGAAGLTGAVLAELAVGLAALFGARFSKGWSAALAAMVLAAPLVIYDAFALFAGPRAARIPAHALLSLAVAAVALAAIGLLATGYRRLHERGSWWASILLLLFAAACQRANAVVLPRLYPWFHATLSVLMLAAAALAAALIVPHASRRRAVRVLAVVALAFLAGLPQLVRSQFVRYTAHERTQLTGLLLRALPLPRPRVPMGRSERVLVDETPLPEGPHRENADVVLITVDALRADHVGAYGYGRPVTPTIDALARRGVRFERAYAQAPHTSFSVASMLTGKYYPTLARLSPGDPHDPIAQVLRNYGWKTAAFYPPAVFTVDAAKLKTYQDNKFQFEYVKEEYLDAFERLDQIEHFFDTEKPRKAFLWLHLFEPHEPYHARPGYDFGKRDIDRYDSEVAYTDAAVAKVLAYLARKRPNAIIILTADHGEAFDEHDSRYHGTSLFEEQVRVPLVIVVPGLKPAVVSGPVELIDIAPTVLGLLDIPIPARMRGTDLGPWLATPPPPASRLPPAFAEVADKRMIVWGTDKLICEMNWGYCSFYDLGADPRELKNAADERAGRAGELKRRLDDWLDDHVRYEPQLVRGLANPDGGAIPKAIERGRLGDLMVMEELSTMLTNTAFAVPVRREAARILVTLPPRAETRRGLEAALGADDSEVRRWAAVAAARLGHEGAKEQLRAIVTAPPGGEEGRDLRVQAALALAHVKDATGVPVLGEALDHNCEDNVLFCQLIILKLGVLRDRRAVPFLLKHLPEWQNRREMVVALGQIGAPEVVPALVERLRSDEYVPVRAEAAAALGRIGGQQVKAAIGWCLRHEREPTVLAACRAALASHVGPSPEGAPAILQRGRSLHRASAQ
jgi:arylsulfatase A-like enzyme